MEGWFWSDDRRFLIKKPYFPFKNQLNTFKMGQNDPKPSAGAKKGGRFWSDPKNPSKKDRSSRAFIAFSRGGAREIVKMAPKWGFLTPFGGGS